MTGATEVADRFFKAIEQGDLETVQEIYADDVLVWHNYDTPFDREAGQTKADSLDVLQGFPNLLDDFRYDVLQREATPTGFVQQHVLRGKMKNGEPFELPACIICEVKDGKITRLDEYFDPAKSVELRRIAAEAKA